MISLSEVDFANENENSANNFNSVTIGDITLYFSYETCVAFKTRHQFYICENIWGTTTGKHLNWINKDKSIRLPRKEFLDRLSQIHLRVIEPDSLPVNFDEKE